MKNSKNSFIVAVIVLVTVVLCAYDSGRADLLDNRIDAPIVSSYGEITFDPTTGTLSTDPTQTFSFYLLMQDGGTPIYFDNYAAPLSISIQVDQNGNLIENFSDTPDLTINGSITIPGVGSYSGTLLTAKATEFGWQAANGQDITYNSFDFRFTITGGALAFLWDGDDLGVSFQFNPTGDNQTFTGSFTSSFYGYFTDTRIGGIQPTPLGCTGVVTNMAIDNSQPFDTVDPNGQPIYPVISANDTVTFSLNVTDCDNSAANVGRIRSKGLYLGRPWADSNKTKITLQPGDTAFLDQNNFNPRYAKLVESNICMHKTWISTPIDLTFDVLLREGCDAKSVSGPAFVNCACVSIKEEVSKDGGKTYSNANNPCNAPNTTLKKGVTSFYYRYTVSNPCAAALQNVQISDPELGINYTIPGTLAAGATQVIDYTTIHALVVPAANVCQAANVLTKQCGTAATTSGATAQCQPVNGTVNYDPGVATVTANGVTDPRLTIFQQPTITVTDQDSANIKCQ
jgi:hypothetical protein